MMWWISSLLFGRYTIWLQTSWLQHTKLRGTDRTGLPAAERRGFLFGKEISQTGSANQYSLSVVFSFSGKQFFHIIPPIIRPSPFQAASIHPSSLLSFFSTVPS